MSTKRSRAFRGIISNLDLHLDPATKARIEKEERQTTFINDAYAKAEADEKAGTVTPSVIYSAIQDQNRYTADPLFDKSREAIAGLKVLPTKQYEITPEGDFVLVLDEGSGALQELLDGKFCHNCEARQPEMPEMWKHIADRLEGLIGPPPAELVADWKHGTLCCYCGARLKIEGDYNPDSNIAQITPDQQQVLETMFGSISGGEPGPRGPAPTLLAPPTIGAPF